mmetsp:Transcript_40360/g.127628  ORF Transcript_40360/g.127628 Transcript_40360/m.127628 type:complete len:263 (-) Transcript_40360:562-1350(-)
MLESWATASGERVASRGAMRIATSGIALASDGAVRSTTSNSSPLTVGDVSVPAEVVVAMSGGLSLSPAHNLASPTDARRQARSRSAPPQLIPRWSRRSVEASRSPPQETRTTTALTCAATAKAGGPGSSFGRRTSRREASSAPAQRASKLCGSSERVAGWLESRPARSTLRPTAKASSSRGSSKRGLACKASTAASDSRSFSEGDSAALKPCAARGLSHAAIPNASAAAATSSGGSRAGRRVAATVEAPSKSSTAPSGSFDA